MLHSRNGVKEVFTLGAPICKTVMGRNSFRGGAETDRRVFDPQRHEGYALGRLRRIAWRSWR